MVSFDNGSETLFSQPDESNSVKFRQFSFYKFNTRNISL